MGQKAKYRPSYQRIFAKIDYIFFNILKTPKKDQMAK